MTIGQERVSTLIGGIYEAAYDRAVWPKAIETLRDTFHGSKACLVRVGTDARPAETIATDADPAFLTHYVEEFAREPNVHQDAVAAAPVGVVFHDHALVGRDRLRASRFWNEWMAPQDMYGGLCCKVLASGPSIWFLDVQHGRNHDAFGEAEAALFGLLARHVRRSIEIGRHSQSARALGTSFSHLLFGAVLVDRQRRIVTMNEAAEALIDRPGSGLRCTAGHLVATHPANAASLDRYVVDACSTRDGMAAGLGGDFLITAWDEDGDTITLAVSIGRFSQPERWSGAGEPCALVILREMALDLPTGFAPYVGDLFGLTPKEAELAAALAAGHSLKDAALDAGMRFSTARSHLERIFRKTGMRQQSQLVALLKNAQPILRRH